MDNDGLIDSHGTLRSSFQCRCVLCENLFDVDFNLIGTNSLLNIVCPNCLDALKSLVYREKYSL